MIPKIEANIAMKPKNEVCTCPKLSIKIKKEPEVIPIMEPKIPKIVSKVLEIVLRRFILKYMVFIL